MGKKVIVLGLDGASSNLLAPWIKAGYLPNLKKIVNGGVSGELVSCLPPVTSPNWKCYSTGKNPGKLGIFWWENIDCRNRKIRIPGERVYKNKEIWDYLSEHGKKVGVINVPLTYPPKKVNGYMISGAPDGKDENYTYPKKLEIRLKKEFNYKVNPRLLNFLKKGSKEAIEEILEIIETRFKVAEKLLREYDLDFLQLVIFYINALQHDFWDGEPVKRAWKLIDKNIGALHHEFKDYNFILVSDHGSNPIRQVFYINTWLEHQGYLKVKSMEVSKFLHRLGISQEGLVRVAEKLGIRNLGKLVPARLISYIPSEVGTIEQEHRVKNIDWEKTKVLASGQGPVYINLDKSIKEYKKFKDELIKKLEGVRNPITNQKIASKVYKGEDIYWGKFLSEAPDIVIDQSPGTHIRGGLGKESVFEIPRRWKAENMKKGIFIACGPDIKKGTVGDISILDVAPTILHLMDIPVSRDMDGKILKEIFRKG
jgi:predicted AlkP superfamily phosphohydrolase/phosphomutase